ncbi:MAG: sigma 54-interacting transcriptional regulator [Marinilabilia sp.]
MEQEPANPEQSSQVKKGLREDILGDSHPVRSTLNLIERAIKVPNMNVSLHGEPGTGKKLVAKTIHENSPRREHPFISININAIAENELETVLFGTEQGAFPEALMTTKGKLKEAGEGTLFIDEVSDIAPEQQISLLAMLQGKKPKEGGDQDAFPVGCRIITATNGDLLQAVRNNTFREDLYYHLVGLPITLPPLRERGEDILLLANHFLNVFCRTNNLPQMHLSPQAEEKLLRHTYPGNIRELKAIVELGAVLSNDNTIHECQIVFDHLSFRPVVLDRELTLKEYNEQIILHFMKKYHSVKEVASRLDIGKSTIYNLLKKHNNHDAD